MELDQLSYLYKGDRYNAEVYLLSPLAWIVRISSSHFESFHLEYDELRKKWLPVEDIKDDELVSAIGNELIIRYGWNIGQTASATKSSSTDFFVIDNGREDIICFWDGDLRVRVILLTDVPLCQNNGELLYYGDDFGTPIAFQTIDYNGEDTGLVLQAVKWYAQYLDYPQMVISSKNPLACLE